MAKDERVTKIKAAAKTLRKKAAAFSKRFKDKQGPKLVRQMVLNHLDDVETFWTGQSLPADGVWRAVYLDGAEKDLEWAERELASLEKQVEQFGGPEKVVFYPKN